MTSQTNAVNKARFEQGDRPQGTDYADLVDSFVALADTTAQTMVGDLTAPNLFANTKVEAVIVSAQTIIASAAVFGVFTAAAMNIGTANATKMHITTLDTDVFSAANMVSNNIIAGGLALGNSLAEIQSAGTINCVTISSVMNAVVTALTSAQTNLLVLGTTTPSNTTWTTMSLPAMRLMRINVNGTTMAIPLFPTVRFLPT